MKLALATSLVAVTVTTISANIIFNKVQPTCNASMSIYQGCLRGQKCLPNNTCVPEQDTHKYYSRDALPRSDGRCGADFAEATCDFDACCSQYGYCGKTAE